MRHSLLQFSFTIIVLCQLSGCASNSDQSGNIPLTPLQIGTSQMVDGVMIWQGEMPPQPYKVISTVTDTRKTDVNASKNLLHSLAAKAKKAGGNGVIILSSDIQTTGGQNFNPAPYTPGNNLPVVDSTTSVTKAQIISSPGQ